MPRVTGFTALFEATRKIVDYVSEGVCNSERV